MCASLQIDAKALTATGDAVFSSTTELARVIRAGHLLAREVLDAHLRQIALHDPALNAVIRLDAERASGTPLRVDEHEVAYWTVRACGAPFNYSGHPAMVLPFAQDHDGLPIGIQLVGKRWGESCLLAVAAALAEVIDPLQRPPGY